MPYTKLSEINPALQGIDPPVSLEQANKIAAMADSIGGDAGWAIAISAFKKGHVAETSSNSWVEKKKSMTCPECGTEIDYMDTSCKGCGAEIVYEDEKESYRSKLLPEDFLVIVDPKKRSTWSLPITKIPGGEPDHAMCGAAWAALHGGFRGNEYGGPNKQEAIDKLISIYKRMEWELPSTKEMSFGIKALGDDRIVLWSSNAFQDDEGEIFATKALEDYVQRKDVGSGSRGRVWFWHVPGTDFADILWQGVVGRYLVEVAQFDNTSYASAMKEAILHPDAYKNLLPDGWGLSQGYLYRASDKEGGVYSFLEKYETSVLPLHRAANKLTMLIGVKSMISDEKRKALEDLVGLELAREVLQGTSEASNVLERLGTAYKEAGAMKKKAVLEEEMEEEDTIGMEEEDTIGMEEEEADSSEKVCKKKKEEEVEMGSFEDEEWEMELDAEALNAIAEQVPVEQAVKEAIGSAEFAAALRTVVSAELRSVLPGMLKILVGTKEEIAKEALGGRITLKPYSATADKDTIVGTGIGGTKEKEHDVVSAIVNNMLRG